MDLGECKKIYFMQRSPTRGARHAVENASQYVGRREREYFPMRAALLTTVHDYLGYGYVAGQVVHGFYGCIRCMDDTMYRQLDRDSASSKTVFMGHRRWLRDDYPWRKHKDLFDGETEPLRPQCTRSGEEIDELLKNWKRVPTARKEADRKSVV